MFLLVLLLYIDFFGGGGGVGGAAGRDCSICLLFQCLNMFIDKTSSSNKFKRVHHMSVLKELTITLTTIMLNRNLNAVLCWWMIK